MTDTGPTRAGSHDAWSPDPEVPEADADEQRRPLLDTAEDLDPEAAAGRDAGGPVEPPLEVSEADLLEQSVEVPDDEEFDRG
jgi:hypothetical protein